MTEMNKMQDNYFRLMDEVILLAKAGNMEQALKIIKEDHGTAVWQTYMNLSAIVDPVIQQQKQQSQQQYSNLLNVSLWFQFILIVIGVPVLTYTIINLTRREKKQNQLFQLLDNQNRILIFDSSKPTDFENEGRVINDMIENLT